MSFNFKKEETKKNYTRAKGMSKYKSKLNRNAKPFVPKEINKKIFVEDINEDIKNKRTILYNKENIQSNIEANRQNNDKEKENIKKYTYKEIKYFENIQRAKEQDLLTEEALDHINQMVNSLSENKMDNLLNKIRHSDSTTSVCDTSKSSGGPIANIISLELWSRQDYTKETEGSTTYSFDIHCNEGDNIQIKTTPYSYGGAHFYVSVGKLKKNILLKTLLA